MLVPGAMRRVVSWAGCRYTSPADSSTRPLDTVGIALSTMSARLKISRSTNCTGALTGCPFLTKALAGMLTMVPFEPVKVLARVGS